jgi:hypothetical protein
MEEAGETPGSMGSTEEAGAPLGVLIYEIQSTKTPHIISGRVAPTTVEMSPLIEDRRLVAWYLVEMN